MKKTLFINLRAASMVRSQWMIFVFFGLVLSLTACEEEIKSEYPVRYEWEQSTRTPIKFYVPTTNGGFREVSVAKSDDVDDLGFLETYICPSVNVKTDIDNVDCDLHGYLGGGAIELPSKNTIKLIFDDPVTGTESIVGTILPDNQIDFDGDTIPLDFYKEFLQLPSPGRAAIYSSELISKQTVTVGGKTIQTSHAEVDFVKPSDTPQSLAKQFFDSYRSSSNQKLDTLAVYIVKAEYVKK